MSLHEVGTKTSDTSVRETVFSLLRWFQRTGELTYRQKELARQLVRGHERSAVLRLPKSKPSYVLYAVRIGAQLKIGFSRSLDSRIKTYRTGSPDVELLATLDLGECTRLHAKNQERQLHKALKQYRIEREIFSLDALPGFRAWQPAAQTLPVERLPRRFDSMPEHAA